MLASRVFGWNRDFSAIASLCNQLGDGCHGRSMSNEPGPGGKAGLTKQATIYIQVSPLIGQGRMSTSLENCAAGCLTGRQKRR